MSLCFYGVTDLPRVFLGLFQTNNEENRGWTRMNADKILEIKT